MKSAFIALVGGYLALASNLAVAETGGQAAASKDHRKVAEGMKAPAARPMAAAQASTPAHVVGRSDRSAPYRDQAPLDGRKSDQMLVHFDP